MFTARSRSILPSAPRCSPSQASRSLAFAGYHSGRGRQGKDKESERVGGTQPRPGRRGVLYGEENQRQIPKHQQISDEEREVIRLRRVAKSERDERIDITMALTPVKDYMGGFTVPRPFRSYNRQKGGPYEFKAPYEPPDPQAYRRYEMWLGETRYDIRKGLGRATCQEFVYGYGGEGATVWQLESRNDISTEGREASGSGEVWEHWQNAVVNGEKWPSKEWVREQEAILRKEMDGKAEAAAALTGEALVSQAPTPAPPSSPPPSPPSSPSPSPPPPSALAADATPSPDISWVGIPASSSSSSSTATPTSSPAPSPSTAEAPSTAESSSASPSSSAVPSELSSTEPPASPSSLHNSSPADSIKAPEPSPPSADASTSVSSTIAFEQPPVSPASPAGSTEASPPQPPKLALPPIPAPPNRPPPPKSEPFILPLVRVSLATRPLLRSLFRLQKSLPTGMAYYAAIPPADRKDGRSFHRRMRRMRLDRIRRLVFNISERLHGRYGGFLGIRFSAADLGRGVHGERLDEELTEEQKRIIVWFRRGVVREDELDEYWRTIPGVEVREMDDFGREIALDGTVTESGWARERPQREEKEEEEEEGEGEGEDNGEERREHAPAGRR